MGGLLNRLSNGKIIFTESEIRYIINRYINNKNTPKKIGEMLGVAESVIVRVLKENNVEIRKKTTKYTMNEHIFDVIDTEEKAYWIGFIWCDGYNLKRNRYGNPTYEFKLSLMSSDYKHLEKFKKSINSNHEIKFYKFKNRFNGEKSEECRVLIANTKFGKKLDEEYGLFANRTDVSKLISKIPNDLMNHFMRGVIDADGSFSCSWTHDNCKNYESYKTHVHISTYENLIHFINNYLEDNGIINVKSKLYTRHEGRDGVCKQVTYCGNINAVRLLDWLYKDSTIYLDRKYEKYLDVKNKINAQCNKNN